MKQLVEQFKKMGPCPDYFVHRGGIWRYEDPNCPIANVVGRGCTKEDAFKHWLAIGPGTIPEK